MSSTTIEATERLTAEPEPYVVFLSRRQHLRLVKRARYPQRDPASGQVTGFSEGQHVGFRDGVVKVPKDGPVELQDTLDGGVTKCDAAEMLEFLRGHRLYGDIHEGFWELAVVAPPHGKLELEVLTQAALNLDEGKVLRFMEQERAGFDRADVLEAAEGVLRQVREMLAAQAEKDAEEAKAKKPPTKAETEK